MFTCPQPKIAVTWKTSLSCNTTFRYISKLTTLLQYYWSMTFFCTDSKWIMTWKYSIEPFIQEEKDVFEPHVTVMHLTLSDLIFHFAATLTELIQAQAPYILLANYRYIHKLSLDGSRLKTVISEPNQRIYTVDYHNRYKNYCRDGTRNTLVHPIQFKVEY